MKRVTRFISALFLVLMAGIAQAQSGGVVVIPLGGDTFRAAVAKTGQTTCRDTSGDLISCSDASVQGVDGQVQAGATWPVPRFEDLGNGTIKDKLTGLIWLQHANCSGSFPGLDGHLSFPNALGFVNALNANQLLTNCGDVDTHDDWRIPNRFELESLLDLSQGLYGATVADKEPALPVGHPFIGVETDDFYWSSSYHSLFADLGVGWVVSFFPGEVEFRSWTILVPDHPEFPYLWPVRGGN